MGGAESLRTSEWARAPSPPAVRGDDVRSPPVAIGVVVAAALLASHPLFRLLHPPHHLSLSSRNLVLQAAGSWGAVLRCPSTVFPLAGGGVMAGVVGVVGAVGAVGVVGVKPYGVESPPARRRKSQPPRRCALHFPHHLLLSSRKRVRQPGGSRGRGSVVPVPGGGGGAGVGRGVVVAAGGGDTGRVVVVAVVTAAIASAKLSGGSVGGGGVESGAVGGWLGRDSGGFAGGPVPPKSTRAARL